MVPWACCWCRAACLYVIWKCCKGFYFFYTTVSSVQQGSKGERGECVKENVYKVQVEVFWGVWCLCMTALHTLPSANPI